MSARPDLVDLAPSALGGAGSDPRAVESAQALERTEFLERERVLRARLEALSTLTEQLAATLSREEMSMIVVERGMKEVRADTCTLYVIDEHDGGLELIAERGCAPGVLERVRRISKESKDRLFQQGSSWVETAEQYERAHPDLARLDVQGPRARAFWCVPLRAEAGPIGLLGMGFYSDRKFEAEERRFIEAFAAQCAQALRRVQRIEREELARRAAEQARLSLAITLRSIGDGVIATDATGRITMLNPVAEELTGWSEDCARGRPLRDAFRIVDEETRGEVESPFERVLREGSPGELGETVLLGRVVGRETPISYSGAPIRDPSGEVQGVVLVFRSISRERRLSARRTFLAEAASALASNLDPRAALNQLASLVVPRLADWCAVALVAPDGRLEEVAIEHCDPRKLALALAFRERHPRRPDAASGVSAVLRTGQSEFYPEISADRLASMGLSEAELQLIQELELRSALVVPLSSRQKTLGAMTLVYAESGRRYNEEDLQFAEDLGRRAGAAVDNARLYQALVEADRRKDEFLAVLSHELRNPLAAIMTAVHLWQSHGPLDDPNLERARDVAQRQVAHLSRMVDDLLDVSRITRGNVRLELQTVDFAALVATTLEDHRTLIEGNQVRLRVELAPGPILLRGDPTRLAQIVGNLLQNCAKFTDAGGEITVRLGREGGAVVLEVVDTGLGMRPELLERLFEPFAQDERTLARSRGGLGLGLALVKGLVDLHGGTVSAQSDGPGQGSAFCVRLPLGTGPGLALSREPDAALPREREAASPDRRARQGLRILLIEDNVDAAEILSTLLELGGHEVRVAGNGIEGLEAARAFRPEVVLCDLGLPGELDGYQVARALRADPALAPLRLVALSGYGRSEDVEKAVSAGFDRHLTKPAHPSALDRILAEAARALAGPRSPEATPVRREGPLVGQDGG